MSTEKATLKDGRSVEFIPKMIGEGGMKRVFFTADKQSVLCFFKNQNVVRDPAYTARLEAILGKYNPTADPRVGAWFADRFCWPTGIVIQPEFGLMTPAYPSNYFFASGPFKGKEKEGRWFSSPKLRKMLPPNETGNFLTYLQLCKRMAQAVRKMHMTGLAHSDLSSRNVLVDPVIGKAVVIDIDSLVVPGLYPPDVLGTPGYIAPEVLKTQGLAPGDPKKNLPQANTDLHALAVLVYEYLLRRHPLRGEKVNATTAEEDERLSMGEKALFIEHPTDKSNYPNGRNAPLIKVACCAQGPYLPKIFQQAFVDGLHNPSARPRAGDWERALYLSDDLLMPCGNASCDAKWFIYDGKSPKPACPWCGWKLKTPIPVLDFHYAPRKGNYIAENHCVVGWFNGPRNLYKWHVFNHIKPVEGVDVAPQARLAFHQETNQWLLWNLELTSMVSPAGNPVPNGRPTAVKDGDEVVLSKEDRGRLISVRMVGT